MEEKELCKGEFTKMKTPAVICLVFAVLFLPGVMVGGIIATILCGILLIVSVVLFLINGGSFVITDKRVYGIGLFKKRVDLPMDMISAVGSGIFSRVTVATDSGRIRFLFLKNKEEVLHTITNCLLERQSKSDIPAALKQGTLQSNADELI